MKKDHINEIADYVPLFALALCPTRDLDKTSRAIDKNNTRRKKDKKTFKCKSKHSYRSEHQALNALKKSFLGLQDQAGDALRGLSLRDLVIRCEVCRGFHLLSPEEWFKSQGAYAA